MSNYRIKVFFFSFFILKLSFQWTFIFKKNIVDFKKKPFFTKGINTVLII